MRAQRKLIKKQNPLSFFRYIDFFNNFAPIYLLDIIVKSEKENE